MENLNNQRYHVLARGVIVSEGHLLIAHCKGLDNTFLPGGHVEFHEGIRETLSREIREELGWASKVKEYIGAVEAEFDHEQVYNQEMNHLFAAEIPGLDCSTNPVSQEGHLEFYWISLDTMEEHNLQPFPVREMIRDYIRNRRGAGRFGTTFSS
ncbi:NUDIX domain-containing protein [Paenibacillus caui]|uniref:NUDIX domain-containing protein n=1 Tax=Paenibacillus caui TaxID=2873927 RepID=UPI001CA80D9D|nr:NUDIX domain-containing protein [Paenibacillus caui]